MKTTARKSSLHFFLVHKSRTALCLPGPASSVSATHESLATGRLPFWNLVQCEEPTDNEGGGSSLDRIAVRCQMIHKAQRRTCFGFLMCACSSFQSILHSPRISIISDPCDKLKRLSAYNYSQLKQRQTMLAQQSSRKDKRERRHCRCAYRVNMP